MLVIAACDNSPTDRRFVVTSFLLKKIKVNLDICKAPLNTNAFSKVLRYGNTQLYTCKQAIYVLTLQPYSITDFWLVILILPSHVW